MLLPAPEADHIWDTLEHSVEMGLKEQAGDSPQLQVLGN